MDKVVMKAYAQVDWEHLREKYKINDEEYNKIDGTIEKKRGYTYLQVKGKPFNKNSILHWVRIDPLGQYIHCEFNPNRYFASTRNNYQIKKQGEINEVMRWLESTFYKVFHIKLDSKGREYHKIHYNIDIQLKEDSSLYSKVFKLLAHCAGGGSDIYSKTTDDSKEVVTGTSFSIGKLAQQVNYDKGKELKNDDLNIHRFETRWDSKNSIELTFETSLVSKISIKEVKKKIGELFQIYVFSHVQEVIENRKIELFQSLINWRSQGNGWLEKWILSNQDKIIDIKMVKDVLQEAGLSEKAIEKNYTKAGRVLRRSEKEQLKIETSFGNYRRINEVYKKITGERSNLI